MSALPENIFTVAPNSTTPAPAPTAACVVLLISTLLLLFKDPSSTSIFALGFDVSNTVFTDAAALENVCLTSVSGLTTEVLTLGLGTTWAICMMYRYQFRHTAYNGHRLKFKGSGLGLLGNIIKWTFFTVITLGIYGLFVPVKKAKWIISNLYYEDEEYVKGESYFDGNTLQFLGISILSFIINELSSLFHFKNLCIVDAG